MFNRRQEYTSMTEGKNTILLQKRQEEWETAGNKRVCYGTFISHF